MNDLPTLLLLIIVIVAIAILAISARGVIAQHREDRRRARLTPWQRGMEDLGRAFNNIASAMVESFLPSVTFAAKAMNDFADALRAAEFDPDEEYHTTDKSVMRKVDISHLT